MKIKIAHLYYDLMNLYGENGNVRALKKYFEQENVECEIHFLTINDIINFNDFDLYYIGMGSEKSQELVIEDLKKYKKEIKEAINNNKYFIMTGNAYEMFGKYIIDFNEKKIECLDIFPYYTKRIDKKDYMEDCDFRIVGSVSGKTKLIEETIIGFINRGGTIHESDLPFITLNKGIGYEPNVKEEGYIYKNFIGTYILGPLFIRNPYFTKYLVQKIIREKNNNYKFKVFKNTTEIKAYESFLDNFKEYN